VIEFIIVTGWYFTFRCLFRVVDITDPSAPLSTKGPMAWAGLASDFALSAWAMLAIRGGA
jgi:hypothetical protein